MKKMISIVLVFVMLTALFSLSASAAGPKVIKIASQGAPGSLEIQTLDRFAELVNEKCADSLKVEVYPSGQLGGLADAIEGVTLGTIEMAAPGLSNLSQLCSDFAAYDMWFYDGPEDIITVYNSDLGQKLNQELIDTAGVRLLSYNNCTAGRMYLWAKEPITTVDGFNGKVIRVPGNPSIATALSAIGTTSQVGFGDMYTAAQTGVIDIGSADISTMISNGFDEIFPYCIEITGNYMPMCLIISEDVYQALSEEEQTVVSESAVEACQYWDTHQDEVREGDMEMLENSKAEMVHMDPDELAVIDEKIHDAIEEYLAKSIDGEIIAQVRELTE